MCITLISPSCDMKEQCHNRSHSEEKLSCQYTFVRDQLSRDPRSDKVSYLENTMPS